MNTIGSVSSLKSKNVPIMQTEYRFGNYDGFSSPHGDQLVGREQAPATVSLGGSKFTFDMPGNGWATVHHSK